MVLFSNPNNPTGHFVSNAQLCKIAEAFPRIPVIIDAVSYTHLYPPALA